MTLPLLAVAVLLSFAFSNSPPCTVLDPDLQGTYQGGCKEGLAHGYGEAQGRDTYVGYFKDGHTHGPGQYSWGPGTVWEGDVFLGTLEQGDRSWGTYRFASGVFYQGGFKGTEHHGLGALTFPDESGPDGLVVLEGIFWENELVLPCKPIECFLIMEE
jgi:hypothetical protein